jgi:hypothetical protein
MDTNGFMYVPGVLPSVYQELSPPKNIKECIYYLTLFKSEMEDMKFQLEINNLTEIKAS